MKYVIEGFYGVKNLGDDYILYSIIQTLSKTRGKHKHVYVIGSGTDCSSVFKLFPDIHFTLIVKNSHGILNRIKRKIDTFFAFYKADAYIFGGGGLFPTDNPLAYYYLLDRIKRSHRYKTKKVAIYGIDLCGIRDENSQKIWKQIAENVDYINFRNKYSADLINEILTKPMATNSPDITFSLSTISENDETIENILQKYKLQKGKYIIWALAMPWSKSELDENVNIRDRYNKLCSQLQEIENRYEALEYTNVFLPFYHETDNAFIQDISEKTVGKCIFINEEEMQLSEKRAIFKYAKACISMRFHGIVFSLYYGIPVAGISYSPKSSQILTENGLEDFVVKFGIRADSGYFKEFDIDYNLLQQVCDKVIIHDNNRFAKVSESLRMLSKENEQNLLNLIDM